MPVPAANDPLDRFCTLDDGSKEQDQGFTADENFGNENSAQFARPPFVRLA
jgi:hypothetical protein